MSCGAAGLALALAVLSGAALTSCGEKEEPVPGPSREEATALVAAGLRAVGSDDAPARVRVAAVGPALRVRTASAPAGGTLDPLLASVSRVSVQIEPFCPKPALLRCRPSFRAWASPFSRRAFESAVAALRRLAERTYSGRALVRRRGALTRIVTPNGELLAAARAANGQVTLSFGGSGAPRRPRNELPPAGALRLEAGAAALEAIRRDLAPPARRALAGVARLSVTAPLARRKFGSYPFGRMFWLTRNVLSGSYFALISDRRS